jgi:hypothetical protein
MPEVFDDDLHNHLKQFEEKKECLYCGESSDADFCDKNCKKAYFKD